MRKLFTFLLVMLSSQIFAQSSANGIPDSVKNISLVGSTGQYTISNPLVYGGTSFTNPPVSASCFSNCKSDYLYFYDYGFTIPLTATINGIEVYHTRGGCNAGSYVIDTLQLAYNGVVIGTTKRDSTSSGTDTLGSSSDDWSATLTPAMLNDNSFGLFVNSTGTGICTLGQFNVEMKVSYNIGSGITSIQKSENQFMRLSPNPAEQEINLQVGEESMGSTYSIYDVTGKCIQTEKIMSKSTKIPLVGFQRGLYFISTKGNHSQTLSFVKL